jgi:hypothetical protein
MAKQQKIIELYYRYSNKTSGSAITPLSYVHLCFTITLLHLYCFERFISLSPSAVLRVTVAQGIPCLISHAKFKMIPQLKRNRQQAAFLISCLCRRVKSPEFIRKVIGKNRKFR